MTVPAHSGDHKPPADSTAVAMTNSYHCCPLHIVLVLNRMVHIMDICHFPKAATHRTHRYYHGD